MSGTTSYVYDTITSQSIDGQCESAIHLTSTVGMITIFNGVFVDDQHKLARDLIAEVKLENDNYIVFDYLIDEYGIGESLAEAQQDLLYSLAGYLASLEKRESRLAEKELRNLNVLRSIIVPK